MRSVYGLTIGKALRAVLVLLVFVCFVLLVGCDSKQELPDFTPLLSDTDTSESATERESESDGETSAPFAKELCIIVPASRSQSLLHRARILGEELTEKTGLPYSIRDDQSLSVSNPDVYELVLGYGAHPDSELWMVGLKKDDYICAAGRYAAVIGGRTEEATISALDAFEDQLLPYVTPERLMNMGVAILEEGIYDRGLVSFNGVDLYDWQIVCEESDSEILSLQAKLLRDEIAARSGYTLEVCTSSEADASKQTVWLSLSNDATGKAYLIPTEGGITLRAEHSIGLRSLVIELCDLLFDNADGDGHCQNSLQQVKTLLIERNRFHLSLLVGNEGMVWESPSEIVRITDWIRKENQDALAMLDMQTETSRYLQLNLSGLYTWQKGAFGEMGTKEGNSGPIDSEELPQEILAAAALKGALDGIRWMTVREGTDLPAWMLGESTPLVVTVYGQTDGEPGEKTASRLDCLYRGEITVNGSPVFVSVYTTVKQIRVEAETLDRKAGILDLWVERLY